MMGNDLGLLQRLADCGGMKAEFLELKRDAERYRWLKLSDSIISPSEAIAKACQHAKLTGSYGHVDLAIDAAMAACERIGAA